MQKAPPTVIDRLESIFEDSDVPMDNFTKFWRCPCGRSCCMWATLSLFSIEWLRGCWYRHCLQTNVGRNKNLVDWFDPDKQPSYVTTNTIDDYTRSNEWMIGAYVTTTLPHWPTAELVPFSPFFFYQDRSWLEPHGQHHRPRQRFKALVAATKHQ